ncbi:MAG: hypothetical protein L0L45_06675 [Bifidobacterium mongoliense]|nr:hypothetical protein [Bifidobacterium mongoliense]
MIITPVEVRVTHLDGQTHVERRENGKDVRQGRVALTGVRAIRSATLHRPARRGHQGHDDSGVDPRHGTAPVIEKADLQLGRRDRHVVLDMGAQDDAEEPRELVALDVAVMPAGVEDQIGSWRSAASS